MNRKSSKITRFKLREGGFLAGKYEVMARLGSGWEDEVYLVRAKGTGIERTGNNLLSASEPELSSISFMPKSSTNCDNALS